MSNPTAGSGEPFWYEWTVGLQKIVEMLRTDSDILSVTLQAHGTKGWDDVVVKRSHDRREFFQVKHSRAEGNLTFGSLVAVDEKGASLLQELFIAFCEMELRVPNDSCIVFTNREAGMSHGRSQQGHSRPPLLKFTDWLKAETKKFTTVSQLVPHEKWNEAWKEWLSQLAGASDAKAFDFLKAFDVKTNQLNLTELTDGLLDELAEIFGRHRSQVRPLLHAFDHALRDWTRSGIPITAETAMDALALERETKGEHRAPPPPAPFFPSRQPFIEDLESLLVDENSPSVIFLSAEPGAGKTSALVEQASERQAWSRISYRTDRDESFFASAEFLDRLLKVRPERWTTLGSRLWSQSYAASALGGDINQAWGIDRSLAQAAFRLEPDSICRLVFSEIPNRDDYWYDRVRDALIGGLTDVVHENRFDSTAKLSLWSLANGFCRWFSEHDVGLLCQLKTALLDSEPADAEKNVLERRLHELTPGEMVRLPRKVEESQDDMTAVGDQATLSASLASILKGESRSILECVRLIAEVVREQPNSKDIIRRLTFQMVNRQNWASSWRFEGGFRELLNLGTLLSEEQMWDLVKAACSEADRGTHWLQAVTSNLHTLLISWGIRRGGDELERFLICHLEMHELWIRGGRRDLPYSEISIPRDEFASTWGETSAQILVFLLNSRSGEVVSSALRGIHALVRQQPKIIPFLFGTLGGDSWKSRWILNSAEAWAFIYPEFTEKARNSIEEWFVHDSLEHRLQAWLILASLAESKGVEKPELPWPKGVSSGEPEGERLRDVLDLPPEKVGLMHIATRHRSADQHIKILEVVFGELPKVRHRAAQLLDDVSSERHLQHPWPANMRQRNDTDIGLPDIGYIVGRALDSSMSGPPLKTVPKLAQAFLPNEEPWVVADSPFPDRNVNGWPEGSEFGDYRIPPDAGEIRRKLLLFASEHNIADGEHVLVGTVEIYTDAHDFHFHIWWEHILNSAPPVRKRKPTTISARTFSWWLGDWWEDDYRRENYPIAFVPGGFQRLAHSFVSWFPNKTWIDKLDWKPHPKNPRIWQRDGRLMARFEQFHGELRDTRSFHSRQSMVSRWVASDEAWEQLQKIGEWRLRDHIEVGPSPEK